jgi:ribosomal protein S21
VPKVKSKKGEMFEGLLRRFNRKVMLSGKILQAKKIRFRKKEGNKRAVRESALRRQKINVKTDYLLKTGKIKEEDLRNRKLKLKIKIK